MKINRRTYFLIVCTVIITGLASRRIPVIPPGVGDALWAMMIFFIIRTLYIKSGRKLLSIVSLILCYLVEFSQLYQAPWLNNIRMTLVGRLVLGQGFLWSDLLAYAIGIGAAVSFDYAIYAVEKRSYE